MIEKQVCTTPTNSLSILLPGKYTSTCAKCVGKGEAIKLTAVVMYPTVTRATHYLKKHCGKSASY